MNKALLKIFLFLVLLIFTSLVSQAAEDSPKKWQGIQKLMTSGEFKAAGLDKLSPEELQQLDQWLIHFLAYDSEQIVHDDKTIQELQKKPIQRRIPGHFSGWTGKTVFTLDNGEVWRQRLPGVYKISLENPVVEISKNLIGLYELRVIKTGRRIGVTRVK